MAISQRFQSRFKDLVYEMEEPSKAGKAEAIGISGLTFFNAYNYGIVPRTTSLMRISDYFNISVEYLIGNTDSDYFIKSEKSVTFFERLEDLRIKNGIPTVYELSKEIHIHRNNISYWKTKGFTPSIEDVVLIADYFKVSVDYLLGRTDDKTPYKSCE